MSTPSTDAIVVGAGIIGASIAWRLAQQNVHVTLFDAGRIGGEASWAGAGMLAPGGEIDESSRWADLALDSLRIYPDYVNELKAESGSEIDFQCKGSVEIATDEAEWLGLLQRAEAQKALRIRSEPMNGNQLRRSVPLLEQELPGALFYPDDALVDPRHILRALRLACCARGVQIREQERVSEIRSIGKSVRVSTDSGYVEAGLAVIAAGAWSDQVAVFENETKMELPSTFPVRGHLLGYVLPADSLGPILRSGRTYVVQRAGGFTIAGTSVEQVGFNRRVDSTIVQDIGRRAKELLPVLQKAPQPEAWIGFRPGTDSPQPNVRRLDDLNIWLAYGHFRNGILLAPITAQTVTKMITSSLETDLP